MSRKAALARKRFCNFVAEAKVAVITDQKNNYFLPTMRPRKMRSLPIKFGDNRVEKTRWMFVCFLPNKHLRKLVSVERRIYLMESTDLEIGSEEKEQFSKT